MKLKQISFKIVSMVMVITILFSICSTTISAAVLYNEQPTIASDKKTLNYVSFGASNVNGFGLEGYLPENVTDFGQKDEYNVYGYKRAPEGSYPALLVEYFESKGYTVNLDQLAMSSMRAEEVRVLLGDTYAGDAYTDWRFNGHNGWYHGAGKLAYAELNGIEVNGNVQHESIVGINHEEALSYLRQVYQQDVINADLITWDCGTNNFGVYLSGRVVDGSYNETISSLSPEIAEMYDEAKAQVFDIVKAEIGEEKFASLESFNIEHIVDSLAYCLVAYCVNYDIVMGRIFELNSDVQVISVSIQNLMKGLVATIPGIDEEIPLGDIINGIITIANLYMAIGSPYADKTLYVDVSEEQHVTFFIDQLAEYKGDPTTLDRDMINCWRMYNGDNMLAQFEPFCFDDNGKLVEPTSGVFGLPTSLTYQLQLVVIDTIAKYMQAGGNLNVLDFGCLAGGDWGTVSDTGMSSIVDAVGAEVGRFIGHVQGGGTLENFELTKVGEDFWAELAVEKGIDVSLMNTFAAYGVRTFIGNAFYAHPNRQGCAEIAEEIIKVLENNASDATPILDRLYYLYNLAKDAGFIDNIPELTILEEIYAYLDSNDYITDNQTLDIIRVVYRHISDRHISNDDITDICKFTYETLIRNESLFDSDRVAIIGNIYAILNDNYQLNENKAVAVVENIYAALDEQGLITDEQSYAIVDSIYNVIADGEINEREILDLVVFVYNTLIVREHAARQMRKMAAAEPSLDDIKAELTAKNAATLRVILGEFVDAYDLGEGNEKSVEKLITGDDALVNDELLLELTESIVSIVEAEENKDLSAAELATKATKAAADTVLKSDKVEDSVRMEILGEITVIVENNVPGNAGNAGGSTDSNIPAFDLEILRKIYKNLNDAGLLTAEQAMDIITYLYDVVISGEELSEDQVIDMVVYIYTVVFTREDLTLEDKIDIVLIVYNTLKQEGYIKEEEIVSALEELYKYVMENYEELYAQGYAVLEDAGYIQIANDYLEIAKAELEALAAEVAGIVVYEQYARLVAALAEELENTANTIVDIQAIIANPTHAGAAEDLYELLAGLEDHAETLRIICGELKAIAIDHGTKVLVALAEKAEEIANKLYAEATEFIEKLETAAYEYLLMKYEEAEAAYRKLVAQIVHIIGNYSEEAARYVEQCLNSAPGKAVAYLIENADEILDALRKYSTTVYEVIVFIIENCAKPTVEFIIDHADIIVTIAKWVKEYGPFAYDLIKVCLEALEFNIEFNVNFVYESIVEAFDRIFALMLELKNVLLSGAATLDEIYAIIDSITDIIENLKTDILNAINASIDTLGGNAAALVAKLQEAFRNGVEAVIAEVEAIINQLKETANALKEEAKAQVEALIEAIENKIAEIEAQIAAVRATLEAKIAELKAELAAFKADIEAKIAELKAQLETAVGEAKARIEAEIARLQAELEAKIAEIEAKIAELKAAAEAKIAELKAQLAAAKAELEAKLAAAKAELEAKIAEIEAQLKAQIAAAKAAAEAKIAELKAQLEANIEDILASAEDYAVKITESLDSYIFENFSRVDLELTNDSNFVSIGGNNAVLENDHYAALIAEYLGINAELLHGVDLRVSDLRALLDAAYENDAYGNALLEGVDAQAYIDAIANADVISVEFGVEDFTTFAFAQIIGYAYQNYGEELSALVAETLGIELGEHVVYEMNWNNFGDLIDAETVAEILAEVEKALVAQGVPTEVAVSETLTINAAKLAVFAVESYLYALANYVYNYAATIEAIHAINPDAEVLVLGAFNALDGFEVAISEDIVIDVSSYAEIFTRIMDLQAVACAYAMDKTHYVYVGGVETIAEADGVIGLLDLISIDTETLTIGFNGEALDASEAGHKYIADQILSAIVYDYNVNTPCEHEYDNACDAVCNLCGEVRLVGGHVYDSCYDTECNECGFTREAGEHAFSGCTDTTCYKCPYVREPLAHTYDGCLDAECNACGYKRLAAHTYKDVCSEECLVCGHTRVTNHTFNEWTLVKEATRRESGEEQSVCSVCGKIATRPVAFTGLGGGAIAGIVSGSTVILGAGGFSAFWFVVKKKSFADLVGVFKSLMKSGQ